jgi:hypothetical protein
LRLLLACVLFLLAVGAGQEYINGTVNQVSSPWQLEVNHSIVYLDGLTGYNNLNYSNHVDVTAWANDWLRNKTVSCSVVGYDRDGWPLVQCTDNFVSINSVLKERIDHR